MQDHFEGKGTRFSISTRLVVALSVGAVSVIIALAFAFRHTFGFVLEKGDALVRDTGSEVKDIAGRALDVWDKAIAVRPEIRIDQRTIIGQSTNIFEVATAQKEIFVRFDQEEEYFGKKRMEFESVYIVKGGFDFQESFSINIDSSNRTITATLPRPTVLSLQRKGFLQIKEAEAWLNRISKEERESAINALESMAKVKARESGIQNDAKKFLEERLNEMATEMGMQIRFVYPGVDSGLLPKG